MARSPRSNTKNTRAPREVELLERLVAVNRVAKVVKGGRRFGFAALVVVGDGRGRAGFGAGKAREVPEAIRKAGEQARRQMVRIPLREGRTLHHDIVSNYGAGRVAIRSALPGTGIIAGGCLRAVFEALGVTDVVAKSIRSSNPYNLIRAAFRGLQEISSPRQVASRRSQKLQNIIARRDFGGHVADVSKVEEATTEETTVEEETATVSSPDKETSSEEKAHESPSEKSE